MSPATPAPLPPLDLVALIVFALIFGGVSILGFVAGRWRRGDLGQLDEWGLGGRRFGTVVSWFLIGGDLYTAYTLIAVPAAVAASGASGFFAVPYTILAYPIMFVIMPRLWRVSKRHGFVTPADFVLGRYGDRTLAFVIALTGILANLPYIALQVVGLQALLARMGIGGSGLAADVPLVIAFAILAAYTYTSGLRAPAAIAFVKDAMIYLVIVVAIVVIPARVGGFEAMFSAATTHFAAVAQATGKPAGAVVLGAPAYWSYATLALGSAMALFVYPHAVTGVLSASRVEAVRRNAVLLPAYSLLLALFALLGYGAIAAHVTVSDPSQTVPALFAAMFPSWFVGVAFAAIGIGALVPAGVMSIAAANLFTRNIYKAMIRPDADDAAQTRTAKIASLVVKVGALAFIVFLPAQQAINFQLLGGIWILQTFPAIVGGLWRRWFHHHALVLGWTAGMLFGTIEAFSQGVKGVKPTMTIALGGSVIAPYIGVVALVLNLAVVLVATFVLDRARVARATDLTSDDDYERDVAAVPTTMLGTR